MKLVRILGAAAVVALAAPRAANAVPIDGTASTVCLVFTGLNSCASVTASVAGSVLTATVTNLGGDLTYNLTAFGFFYTGTSTASALTLNPTPQSNSGKTWANGEAFGLDNPGPSGGTWLGIAGRCQGQGCSAAQGLSTGESITLTFSITGSLTGGEDNIFFGFRGQEWNNDSFKCYEGHGGTPEGAECIPAPCEGICEPPTTIPEPATMLLLATGLVGMGGATILRRRRQKDQD